MKFEQAVNEKACLFAVSKDHSDFCGKRRADGDRAYCAGHRKKATRRKAAAVKADDVPLQQWPKSRGQS